jgi:uncharacterized membrane protein (DUF4010 family)
MFRVSHALIFAAVVTTVMIAAAILNAWLGPRGALLGATIAALAELQAAAATVGQLHSGAVFDTGQARWALVALLGASALSKTIVAVASGGRAYGLRVGLGLALMVAAAVTAVLLT